MKKFSSTFNKYKNIIINFLKNNKGYVFLFFALYIFDLALRVFYNRIINYYHWYNIIPNLFSIIWILLILNLTYSLKNKTGKTIYLIYFL